MKLLTLVRFGQEQHIREFISKGLIYMNQISYFQKLEDSGLRGDRDENMTALYQPYDIELEINGRKIEDFAGPISLYVPDEDQEKITNIFCMLHICEGMQIREDKKIFDPRVLKFGDSMAIVSDLVEFEKRLKKKLNQMLNDSKITQANYRPVNYVPYNSYSGSMNAFNKTDLYSWQNEFRIGISASKKEETFQFEIGSLKDICAFHKTSDFKNFIKHRNDGSNELCF